MDYQAIKIEISRACTLVEEGRDDEAVAVIEAMRGKGMLLADLDANMPTATWDRIRRAAKAMGKR